MFRKTLFAVAGLLLCGTLFANAQCAGGNYQLSPPGGGISKVEWAHATGNVSFMTAWYNRGHPGSLAPPNDDHWLRDSLEEQVSQDSQRGEWIFKDKSKFDSPGEGQVFSVAWTGARDSGRTPYTEIAKQCTATQTAIQFYNGYDRDPNFALLITWTKSFGGAPVQPLALDDLMKIKSKRGEVQPQTVPKSK